MCVMRYAALLCIGSALAVTLPSFSPAQEAGDQPGPPMPSWISARRHACWLRRYDLRRLRGHPETSFAGIGRARHPGRHVRQRRAAQVLNLGKHQNTAPAHHRLKSRGAQLSWAILFAIEGMNEPIRAESELGPRALRKNSEGSMRPSKGTRRPETSRWRFPPWRICATARQAGRPVGTFSIWATCTPAPPQPPSRHWG